MPVLAHPVRTAGPPSTPLPAVAALERIDGFTQEMVHGLAVMAGNAPPEAVVDARLDQLRQEVRAALGHIRHLLGDPLDLTLGADGHLAARGPFGAKARRVVEEAVSRDPLVYDAITSCEALVRALALARAAQAVREAATAAPAQAEGLWLNLNERIRQIRAAAFTFRLVQGGGIAFLVDAAGHPLADWRRPRPLALAGARPAA